MYKMSGVKKGICIGAFMALILLLSAGCSVGGNNQVNNQDVGTYRISVAWPGQERAIISENAKIIPSGSNSISVSVTGIGLTNPITSSIAAGITTLVINNIPSGSKTVLIKALNGDVITAERKESFYLTAGQTVTSDSVPLGVAITGIQSNPVFEPSNFSFAYGTKLYIQNWLGSPFTFRMRANVKNIEKAIAETVSLSAATVDNRGTETFSSGSVTPCGNNFMTLDENQAAAGTISAPFSGYTLDTAYIDHTGVFGVCVDMVGNIYTSESGNVYKYDSNFSNPQTLYSGLNSMDIAVDKDNNIYFGKDENKVVRYHSGGTTPDVTYSGLNTERGICVDRDNNLFVADFGNQFIRKFNSAGTLIANIPKPSTTNSNIISVCALPSGHILGCNWDGNPQAHLYRFTSGGSVDLHWNPTSLYTAASIIQDLQGNYIVADYNGTHVYNTSGTLLYEYIVNGVNNRSCTTDARGNIYVAGWGQNKVYKYKPVP